MIVSPSAPVPPTAAVLIIAMPGAISMYVTVKFALFDVLPLLSLIVYGIVVLVPVNAAFGVNVTLPDASTLQLPSAVVTVFWIPAVAGSRSTVAASMVPSGSLSFAPTAVSVVGFVVLGTPGFACVSSTAVGA